MALDTQGGWVCPPGRLIGWLMGWAASRDWGSMINRALTYLFSSSPPGLRTDRLVQACLAPAPTAPGQQEQLQLQLTKGRFSVGRQRFVGRTDVVLCADGVLGSAKGTSIVALEQVLNHATGG